MKKNEKMKLSSKLFIVFFIDLFIFFVPCALIANYQSNTEGNFTAAFFAFSIISGLFLLIIGIWSMIEYADER